MTRTVIVTGAGSGIGLATVRAFLDGGWHVVATMRRPEKGWAAGLSREDPRLLVEALDVTVPEDAQRVCRRVTERWGRTDVLVNNAGYGPMGAIEFTSSDEMLRVLRTNTLGPMHLIQAALPLMRSAGQGRIVNVSSMGGEFTTPFAGVYHASKYALESLSDALRVEVAPFGIEVVVVQPGPVATELAASAVEGLAGAARAPYAARLMRLAETSRRQMEAGTGVLRPEAVAHAIVKAATVRRPRTRYKVGSMARMMPVLRRLLPDRLWDAMWMRVIPVDSHVPAGPTRPHASQGDRPHDA